MFLIASTAAAVTTSTVIGLTITEIITTLIFICGFFISMYGFLQSFKKELHASLEKHGETTKTEMRSFEERIVAQIREEIKTNISLAESKQEARLAVHENKIGLHEEDLKGLRDVKYRITQLETEIERIKVSIDTLSN
jgi:hypothetical protein